MTRQEQIEPKVNISVRAWRAIMETYAAITPLLETDLRNQTDLDLLTYDVLLHVYEARKPGIRMTDLARRVVLTKSGLTATVDRLEDRGLMARTPDPDDRRATRIRLTERGTQTFLDAASIHVADIATHFGSRLTDEGASAIVKILEPIRAVFAEDADPHSRG